MLEFEQIPSPLKEEAALRYPPHNDSLEITLLIEGFIEGHPGQHFSLERIANAVDCSAQKCLQILEQTPHVQIEFVEHGKKRQVVVTSSAVPLEPTLPGLAAGLLDEVKRRDKLGKEAREDYWERENMYLAAKRRKRVTKRF